MKKIDILNFITDFRKAPNNVKTHPEIVAHLGQEHAATIHTLVGELKQSGVLHETEQQGEKLYRVGRK